MDNDTVFPAHAGMSPRVGSLVHLLNGFPRSRGDEPWGDSPGSVRASFSPLTRG